MPLYKRKIISSQNGTTTEKLKSNNEQNKKRTFKTPLIQNDFQLNHFNKKNSFKEDDKQIEKLAKPNFKSQKLAHPEFQVNFEESQDQLSASKPVEQTRMKRLNSDIQNSEIPVKKVNKNKSEDNVLNKKSQIISNQVQNEKEKSSDSNERKMKKKKKGVHEQDVNNNEKIDKSKKKRSTKTKSKKSELNSNLNESIISLWQQSDTPPSLEPPEHLTYHERLLWLQDKRSVGLYVQCDNCNKFRYLKDTADPLELPDFWFCRMNPDKNYNKCAIPEYSIPMWEEADLIHNLYNAGSIVWAKLDGYPWWPAMVDDDPDTEMYYWLNGFSDIPTHYHVVFFDSEEVSRAWLKPAAISKFKSNIDNPVFGLTKRMQKYKVRMNAAKKQAENALELNVADRLRNYSFLARWTKSINAPRDFIIEERNKKKNLKKRVKKTEIRNIEKKSKTSSKQNTHKFNLDNFKKPENGYDDIISQEIFEDNELFKDFDDLFNSNNF